jgi:hypothetical protein
LSCCFDDHRGVRPPFGDELRRAQVEAGFGELHVVERPDDFTTTVVAHRLVDGSNERGKGLAGGLTLWRKLAEWLVSNRDERRKWRGARWGAADFWRIGEELQAVQKYSLVLCL